MIALAAVAGGCAGTQPAAAGKTLDVALTEFRIDPQTVRAHAGRLTIVVRNYGRRTHNFVLSRGKTTVGSTIPLWPGQDSKITVTLQTGNYLMASTILSDRSLGEYGTLVVS